MYKGYLIDLDGTAYHGTKVVKETLEFVKALHEKQISYLFLTNNSTKTPQMVADVLADLGYPVTEQQVYTPSMATAQYIYDENPNAKGEWFEDWLPEGNKSDFVAKTFANLYRRLNSL